VFKDENRGDERNPAGIGRKSGGAPVAHRWTGARFETRRDLCRRRPGGHQDNPAWASKARPLGVAQGQTRPRRGGVLIADKKCPAAKDRANLKDENIGTCTRAPSSAQP